MNKDKILDKIKKMKAIINDRAAPPKNEDEGVYFYFLISVVFLLFILFGSIKL